MSLEHILVKGAREHNLKNIDVTIPRNKLVVLTGISGSGKSSLAFDTIYAEGQRRYMESLSAYARQFLGRMEKPDVDYIEGLSPAISIDQKGISHNPRSTVGTVTEIYDYLRLLFARVGKPHCPKCRRPIVKQTVQQIVDAILELPKETRFLILAPVVRGRKGEYKEVFEQARKKGFVRVRVDGTVHDLTEKMDLDKKKRHNIEVVVDRLVMEDSLERIRLADSVETALKLAQGVVLVTTAEGPETLYSEHFACIYCGVSLEEIEPRTFSFNSPHGACPDCTGLGHKLETDPNLVVPNPDLSIAEGAIQPWQRAGAFGPWYMSQLESVARKYGFSVHVPVKDLPRKALELVLYGSEGRPIEISHITRDGRELTWYDRFEGVVPNVKRRYRETKSDYIRRETERYMVAMPCPSCQGKRLRPESLAVTIDGQNIMDVCAPSVVQAMEWVKTLGGQAATNGGRPVLSDRDLLIAHQILKEIETRLKFLLDIGLGYLSLDRAAGTLSGGESQRIRLATQIGSGLMGVLYVCDEPSVGLHPADDARLIETLKRLRDLGNTVIVVEHDEAIMRAADWIIDLGPGAGAKGGYVVSAGSADDISRSSESITGAYLSGRESIPMPRSRRPGNGEKLVIKGARENNLKEIDSEIPLGMLVCVTGVSGSGKSSLISEVLYKKLAQHFYRAKDRPGACDAILGLEHIDKVINIDQSPIGRTPRSNPTTYTGAFTYIREVFTTVPESRARGYRPGRFSFNVKGGRCEACQGEGYIEIEMQFLPDVTVPCEVCKGKRYDREALDVLFKGKNIADVLDMTVDEACEFFANIPRIRSNLQTMKEVGLGYIKLGQPATTLSGGEAQRVKLSTELSRRSTGLTLYILDEPTTGLSFYDTAALLSVLQRLADAGNTVVIIEHHLDIIKAADWIIDLGPGAGDQGGWVMATGTPEQVATVEESLTGQWLRRVLDKAGIPSFG